MRSLPPPKIAALLMCVWSLALLAVRFVYSGTDLYGFFVWNLFLAIIPLAASTLLVWFAARRKNAVVEAALLVVWLAFLPNAPYLMTDLIHLEWLPPVPVWYDSILLGSFALTGLLITYLSVADVERVIATRAGRVWGGFAAYGSLALSGFGIYAGRFLRWNSWDIVTEPRALWTGVLRPLTYPTAHVRTWAVTVLYGVGLMLGYFVLRSVAGHFAETPSPDAAARLGDPGDSDGARRAVRSRSSSDG